MKTMLVIFSALVAVATAQTSLNLDLSFHNRFGNIKVRQSCLGMDQASQYFRRVDAAIQTCFPKFNTADVAPAPEDETRYSADELSSIKDNINEEVDYFRCVMNEMGITDSGNNLKLDSMVADIQALDIALPLKGDLVQAVNQCSEFAKCVPVGKDPYPVPSDVVSVQYYLFCERELRSLACVKNDARYIVDQFDLSGADGRLDFLASDSEKVAALLFSNAIVGPDDFGLYE